MTAKPTERLGDYCAGASFDDLPPAVVDRLKQHLLDTVGITIAARAHAGSSGSIEAAVSELAADGEGEATVVPTGERRTAEHAALLNGAYAHSLDFDDTHRSSSLHPGAPVVPAALAVAEREGASVRRLLAAISIGYDVTCTVGEAVGPDAHYGRGFHITATCGTFGATAAAGVVAGLDEAGFVDAFGVNGSQAAGSIQFLANGAWNKRLHPGLAARRAVVAVALAEAGFRGAADPIEGDYGFLSAYSDDPVPERFDDLVGRHAVTETALKPYPCCRYMHAALDALVDIGAGIDAGTVESVRVELPKPGVRLTGDPLEAKRSPSNFVDCQFSMPFGAALALTEGAAGLRAFLDAQTRLDDPDFAALMAATDVTSSDDVMAPFPERWPARVVVETAGDRYERFVDVASGEPEKPLGWDGVTEKFRSLAASAGFPDGEAEAVVETVTDLESATLPDLFRPLRRAADAAAPADD